jgi:3-oxoacyl-[acyl-carrier-protein] synthase II
MPRVAITGVGAITALGPDRAAFLDGLRAGRSGLGELTLFDARGLRSRIVGQAPEPRLPLDEKALASASRPDRFGLAAAFEAVAQAGLGPRQLARAAVVFGTGTGGVAGTERYLAEVADRLPPVSWLVPHQPASVTDLVARHLGAMGPRATVMTACSSSAIAIGMAADRIRLGRVEVALAGGAEGLCRLTATGFGSLRATSPTACRPFDRERDGLNLGEGGAVLVLESWAHAQARGATILAELGGWGVTADAHHITAPLPSGEGAARAMQAALDDARLPASVVDYVNAHGTATPQNDASETQAIRAVLGDRATAVPVSSIKSMVGHTLGAAGAIEAVAAVLALCHHFVPPTVNLRTPDPALGLDYVPGSARPAILKAVLSNSFAFGGNNASLLLLAS